MNKNIFTKLISISFLTALFTVFAAQKNSFAFEFTITGMVYNSYLENPQPNQLILFEFLDTTIVDSAFTNDYGYYEKTFTMGEGDYVNNDYYIEVTTYDSCYNVFTSSQTLLAYNGTEENVDFVICDHFEYCYAEFSNFLISEKEMQFIDESFSISGIKSWHWDFGDGSSSTEQNPTHQYDSAGFYYVSLSINTFDTCNSSVYYIISIPKEQIINGYVTASGMPLTKGKAYAYTFNNQSYQYDLEYGSAFSIDSGHFSIPFNFYEPYIIYVVPEFDSEYHFPEYFPTYYADSTQDSAYRWENALAYYPTLDGLIEINLIKRDRIFYGHGSVSGYLEANIIDLVSTSEICALLLNQDFEPVKFDVLNNLEFEMAHIPYGDYYLLINAMGIPSSPFPISLTEENANQNIKFVIGESGITDIKQEINEADFSVYPNPFISSFFIEFMGSFNEKTEINVHSVTGNLVHIETLNHSLSGIKIELPELTNGLYFVSIKTKNNTYTQKIIKTTY